MKSDRNHEPSDTLGNVLRLAENVKIAFELVEEKSPNGNRKLDYLLKNLSHEIGLMLASLYEATNTTGDKSSYEEVDFEVVVDGDDQDISGEGKVI